MSKILERYDATALIGLAVVVVNGAKQIIDVGGDGETDTYVHIPQQSELEAAAAMARCHIPNRLTGAELRAIRKIMGMTARELSDAMGENTAVETISRWENEKEIPGGYVEKLLRITICEHLKGRAPGVDYDYAKLIRTKWSSGGPVPAIELRRVLLKSQHTLNDTWTETKDAA